MSHVAAIGEVASAELRFGSDRRSSKVLDPLLADALVCMQSRAHSCMRLLTASDAAREEASRQAERVVRQQQPRGWCGGSGLLATPPPPFAAFASIAAPPVAAEAWAGEEGLDGGEGEEEEEVGGKI